MTPSVQENAILKRLVTGCDYQAIILVYRSWISTAPMKHQRLKFEFFQTFTDVADIMAAKAALSSAGVD